MILEKLDRYMQKIETNWVVCLPGVESVSSLYILEIKPLSEVSLATMFSHIVGSLFILMVFSLAMQKLFNLMRSHLFILVPCFRGHISEDIAVWNI